jgi:hypothetical protein
MASFSNPTSCWWKPGAARQFPLHSSSIALCLLPGLIIGSCICLPCTLSSRVTAAEPQDAEKVAQKVALQGDGRFLGYTRLREGTRVPETLGTVVALGPRRWAFVPAAEPALEPVQAVTESESVEITVTQRGGTVTRRVDSVTLSTKVLVARDREVRSRGDAAASA